MLTVVRAFDRCPIAEIATDDLDALEHKLNTAHRVFQNRSGWLKPYQRLEVLRRLGDLMRNQRDHFSHLIAEAGGKPLTDARIEADPAIGSIGKAAHEIRNFVCPEYP